MTAFNRRLHTGHGFVSRLPWQILAASRSDQDAAEALRQQNFNPATTNWVTAPTAAAVVNQVIAAQTNNQNFYRLVSP